MKKVLISACLLGDNVKYSGGNNLVIHPFLEALHVKDFLVPFCPEVEGGLATPREPAEIEEGFSGKDVLDGRAKVVTITGEDVTEAFLKGAQLALHVNENIVMAILKKGSPSCGNKVIYDGTHSGVKKAGQGVSVALLEKHGIKVFNEEELDEAQMYWETL